jgi:hypothetical protein
MYLGFAAAGSEKKHQNQGKEQMGSWVFHSSFLPKYKLIFILLHLNPVSGICCLFFHMVVCVLTDFFGSL